MTLRQLVTRSVLRSPRAYLALFSNIMIAVAFLFAYGTIFFHKDSILNEGAVVAPGLQAMFLGIFCLVVVAVSVALLYSISALYKEREMQFGLFLLMGMSRKQLQALIAGETALVGFFSILCGLLLGSGICTGVLYWLGQSTGLSLSFYFSLPAFGYAAGTFAAILLLIALVAPYLIQRRQVLVLLQGDRRPKVAPQTSLPWALFGSLCMVGFVGNCLVGSIDYQMYTIFSCLAFLLLGGYFFYSQGSVGLAKRLRHKRNFAWQKGRILWLSNLDYRLRDNARLFYVLTLTLLFAWGSISALSSLEQTFKLLQGPARDSYQAEHQGPMMQADGSFPPSHRGLLEEKLRTEFGVAALQRVHSIELVQQPVSGRSYKVFHLISSSEYQKVQPSTGGPRLELAPHDLAVLHEEKPGSVRRGDLVSEFEDLLSTAGVSVGNKSSYSLPFLAMIPSDTAWVVGDELLQSLPAKLAAAGTKGIQVREVASYLFAETSTMKSAPMIRKAIDLMDSFHKKGETHDERFYLSFANIALAKWIGALIQLSVFLLAAIFWVIGNNFLLARMYTDVRMQRKQFQALTKVGVTKQELGRAVTVQMAMFFFLPLLVTLLLTQSFFYYISRILVDLLEALQRSLSTMQVFTPAATFVFLLLLLEVAIFFLVRWRILRTLEISK